jgi:hypothetical protein
MPRKGKRKHRTKRNPNYLAHLQTRNIKEKLSLKKGHRWGKEQLQKKQAPGNYSEEVFSKMELLSVKQVPEGQATLHVSNKISRLQIPHLPSGAVGCSSGCSC